MFPDPLTQVPDARWVRSRWGSLETITLVFFFLLLRLPRHRLLQPRVVYCIGTLSFVYVPCNVLIWPCVSSATVAMFSRVMPPFFSTGTSYFIPARELPEFQYCITLSPLHHRLFSTNIPGNTISLFICVGPVSATSQTPISVLLPIVYLLHLSCSVSLSVYRVLALFFSSSLTFLFF